MIVIVIVMKCLFVYVSFDSHSDDDCWFKQIDDPFYQLLIRFSNSFFKMVFVLFSHTGECIAK